jgi:hypothetical protein
MGPLPHLLEELFCRDHAVGVVAQIAEHRERARLEGYGLVTPPEFPGLGIHPQRSKNQVVCEIHA